MATRIRILACLLSVLLTANGTLAGIRPSFSLEGSVWSATDIILVKDEGKQRPAITVVESWKGDLRPGDIISLTGLPAESVSKPNPQSFETTFPNPVEGRRIVYFLTHTSSPTDPSRTAGQWVGSAWSGRYLWASAAFIDGDSVGVFLQLVNPGSSSLHPSHHSLAQLKANTQAILAARDELERAIKIQPPDERAKALVLIARNGYSRAQREAIQRLGECGAPAVPMLRTLVISASKDSEIGLFSPPSFEFQIIDALAAATGPDKSSELTALIADELTYWNNVAPALQDKGSNTDPDAQSHGYHFGRTCAALRNLQGAYKPTADDPVRKLRDLWKSIPQLSGSTVRNEMIEACDAVLR